MADASDDRTRELVLAAQRGDAGARDELLRLHLERIRAFVRLRSDARLRQRESESDLVQSVCREVLNDLGRFEFRDAAGFRAWLSAIALNKLREKWRFHGAERRGAQHEAGALDELGEFEACSQAQASPSQHAIANEARASLEAAFDRLGEEHREVVLLSRVLGLPHAEIARRMGLTEVAVRSRLSRALVALSAELERGTGRC